MLKSAQLRGGASAPLQKDVQSRSRLQLLSLLVIVGACLSGGVEARRESSVLDRNDSRMNIRQNFEQEFEIIPFAEQEVSANPHLKQESTYGGYYVPEKPWSTTEQYLRFNSFLTGAKLEETYGNSDECVNNIVVAIDQDAYYKNNKTDHARLMKNGTKTSYFEPYLNVTGTIGGPVADSLPSCYNFFYAIYETEEARYNSFNNNVGDFFLAFLFNQMGHALTFQKKFKTINEMKEQQNYQGVWQEYGDLFYLIWTFSPIDDAAMDDVRGYVDRWMDEHEWLDDETSPEMKEFTKALVTTIAKYTHFWGTQVGDKLNEHQQLFTQNYQNVKDLVVEKIVKPSQEEPVVGAAPTGFNAATDFMNGFFEGLVDVFPFESNPQRCRNNFTVSYDAIDRMFVKNKDNGGYDWKEGWGDETFNQNIITDTAYILKLPFGASYSCYWGFSTLIIQPDPYEDGVLTEDEELELLIKLGTDIVTNLFFNAGYIYADSFAIYDVVKYQEDSTLYWKRLGIYSGDITIRFLWRKRFTRNFEYE